MRDTEEYKPGTVALLKLSKVLQRGFVLQSQALQDIFEHPWK